MGEKTKSEQFAEADESLEILRADREGRVTAKLEEATAQFSVGIAKVWKLSAQLADEAKVSTRIAEIVKAVAETINLDPDGLVGRKVRAGGHLSSQSPWKSSPDERQDWARRASELESERLGISQRKLARLIAVKFGVNEHTVRRTLRGMKK